MNLFSQCIFILFSLVILFNQSVKGLRLNQQLNLNATQQAARSNPFLIWWNFLNRRTTSAPFTSQKACETCQCGRPNIYRRIVGGQPTKPDVYPWVGMLLHSNRYYCGLSLINNLYALTASHCVNGFKRELMTIRFLQHDRNIKNPEMIERSVTEIVKHPNYIAKTFESDIALLRLNSPIKFNNIIHPVCLPKEGDDFIGQNGIVTGWGALSETGPIATTLQEVMVPILSNRQCEKYFPFEPISENMFCAGYAVGAKDACQGDSGGPLHVIQNRQYQIAGLVSWGDGCARPNKPGVYTRVNKFLNWIRSNTADACYC